MTSAAAYWTGGVLIAAGLFFQLVAAVGLVRLRDVYSRLHVVCITDTLGVPLVMIGAAVLSGLSLTSLKLVLVVFFLYLTSPLVGHLLARAALESGLQPWDGRLQKAVPARARKRRSRR